MRTHSCIALLLVLFTTPLALFGQLPAAAPSAVGMSQAQLAHIDEAVADTLGELICSEEPNRIEVLRELLRSGLILEAGSQMPALADRITSPKCPVAKTLMDEDKRAIATASEKAALLTTSR